MDCCVTFWNVLTWNFLQAPISRHARCQELGLQQDLCHPPPSLREIPSRPGVEAHWYVFIKVSAKNEHVVEAGLSLTLALRRVWAEEQAWGVEGQVHPGQNSQSCQRAADSGWEGPQASVRRYFKQSKYLLLSVCRWLNDQLSDFCEVMNSSSMRQIWHHVFPLVGFIWKFKWRFCIQVTPCWGVWWESVCWMRVRWSSITSWAWRLKTS